MSQIDNNGDAGKPSNVYLLNVAFYSFTLFALGEMFVAIYIARSRAMIADSCAMLIDSMTYLFNSWAERVKNKSSAIDDGSMSQRDKEMKKLEITRQRLLLEIAPPLISVLTLIGLTAWVGGEAVETLLNGGEDEESSVSEDPDIVLMFVFSGLNLVLDLVNVMCFARAKHAFGFTVMDRDHRLLNERKSQAEFEGQDVCVDQREEKENDAKEEVNLNMCSAFTHVFADTLRSTAVLLAAGISYIFKVGEPTTVDAIASLAVSIIILMSLGPLLRGIYCAWVQLSEVKKEMKQFETPVFDHIENEVV